MAKNHPATEIYLLSGEKYNVTTILIQDIDFQGKIIFDKPLVIRGRMRGNIEMDSLVYIDEMADVEAGINAASVAVKGYVKGNLTASSSVELFSTAVVEGDISAPYITIEKGAVVNGECRMKRGVIKNEAV